MCKYVFNPDMFSKVMEIIFVSVVCTETTPSTATISYLYPDALSALGFITVKFSL